MSLIVLASITSGAFATVDSTKMREAINTLKEGNDDCLDEAIHDLVTTKKQRKETNLRAEAFFNWCHDCFKNLTNSKLKRTGFVLGAAATAYGIAYYNTPKEDTTIQPGQPQKSRSSRAWTTMTGKLKNPWVIAALSAATLGAGYWVYKG